MQCVNSGGGPVRQMSPCRSFISLFRLFHMFESLGASTSFYAELDNTLAGVKVDEHIVQPEMEFEGMALNVLSRVGVLTARMSLAPCFFDERALRRRGVPPAWAKPLETCATTTMLDLMSDTPSSVLMATIRTLT